MKLYDGKASSHAPEPADVGDAALAGYAAERLAAEDERRSAALARVTKARCRLCGQRFTDEGLASGGKCSRTPQCRRTGPQLGELLEGLALESPSAQPVVKTLHPEVQTPAKPPPTQERTVSDAKKCSECEKQLRGVSKEHGKCFKCRLAAGEIEGRAANGKILRDDEAPPEAEKPRKIRVKLNGAVVLPPVEELTNEFLVACVTEARLRPRRIRDEVEAQLRPLEEALALLDRERAVTSTPQPPKLEAVSP